MGSFLEEGTRHMGSGEQPRVGTGILGEEAGQRLEGYPQSPHLPWHECS